MKHFGSSLLFVTGFLGGALTLAALPVLAQNRELPTRGLNTLVEVMNRLSSDYVDPVPDSRLIEQCIAGMTALDDRSYYMNKKDFADLTSRSAQAAVGLELKIENYQAIVVAPIAGTPAALADIQSGDILLAVDSVAVTGRKLQDTAKMLRGDPGSKITLTMFRPGTTAPVDKALIRAPIVQPAAVAERLPGGLVYLRISTFHTKAAVQVGDALKPILQGAEKPTGLVLDLRQNPGGVLSAAIEVSDLFLDTGQILGIEGRIASSNRTWSATPGGDFAGVPVAVLVDSGSAAASEIVADALRTHAGAKLIGAKTYGLGSIQTILPLADDSALRITTARWKTASGKIIEGNGLTPDIVMDVSGKRVSPAKDPVVQRAVKELGRPSR